MYCMTAHNSIPSGNPASGVWPGWMVRAVIFHASLRAPERLSSADATGF